MKKMINKGTKLMDGGVAIIAAFFVLTTIGIGVSKIKQRLENLDAESAYHENQINKIFDDCCGENKE